MNLLSDIITYIRRIIKTPSNEAITDELLIDYINRFWLMDVDARMQLFDLKTKYQFQTIPGIDQYNMPLYDQQIEAGGQVINFFPVYQGFFGPVFVNGIQTHFQTLRNEFQNLWPTYVQSLPNAAVGDGGSNYTLNLPFFPALPGHVDITGIIATGTNQDPIFGTELNLNVPTTSVYSAVYLIATDSNGKNITVADSGQFLLGNTGGDLYGLLMEPGNAPDGNLPLGNGIDTNFYDITHNTVNYNTGVVNVRFNSAIPSGTPIQAQCYFFQPGIPRSVLFYNNIITVRPPPNIQYLVEMDAYLTPAAFLASGSAIPFGYMSEYIARGAARKILADTGDVEQFQFYEPLFREQELLVWKRSQRQWTSTRTQTIYSQLGFNGNYNQSSMGV